MHFLIKLCIFRKTEFAKTVKFAIEVEGFGGFQMQIKNRKNTFYDEN